MYSVKISEEAELDLEEAYFWYEEQVKQLGSEFIRVVDKSLATIQKKSFSLSFYLSKYPPKLIATFPLYVTIFY